MGRRLRRVTAKHHYVDARMIAFQQFCDLQLTSPEPHKRCQGGRCEVLYLHRCSRCGRERYSKYDNPRRIRLPCGSGSLVYLNVGPGSELTDLIHSLGLKESSTCQCEKRKRQMNLWGVDGCRANRDTIISWLKEEYKKATPEQKRIAKRKAFKSGLWTKLWRDPVAGLVDEAIRQAEAKAS